MTENAATLVIPLLDQEDAWLEKCLKSCLSQTVPCDVIVVVSPDARPGNLRMLEEYRVGFERLSVIQRPKGTRFAGAINLGIRSARTKRLGLVFSDDWIEPNAVEACLGHDADIVSSSQVGFDSAGTLKVYERILSAEQYDSLESDMLRAEYLGHFFLFNREKLLEIGGVDEKVGLTGADDLDMIWCLLEVGATVAIVEDVLYYARDHDGPRLTLRDRDSQIVDMRKILVKHGVLEADVSEIVERHAHWYGLPVHEAMHALSCSQNRGIIVDEGTHGIE